MDEQNPPITELNDDRVAKWVERFRVRNADKKHPAMQVTMALVADHQGELRCIGSAFAVAPGLAITASHVVQDLPEYQQKRDGYKKPGATFGVVAVQFVDDNVCSWLGDEIYGSVSSDIAFLRFTRPNWWGDGENQLMPSCARLTLNPPEVGDELTFFGFPESSVQEGTLYVSPTECNCRVIRVDLKTDIPTSIRPLSHIDVEGEMVAGMSGGPCFDKNWNVVGVNSKGWDGQQLAHVALLWPAMKTQIDLYNTGTVPRLGLVQGWSCARHWVSASPDYFEGRSSFRKHRSGISGGDRLFRDDR